MQLKGKIQICYRNEKTGREIPILGQKNLHMYECADIMAQLLNGAMSYRLNRMYFEYQNIASAPSVTPIQTRGNGRNYFNFTDSGYPVYHDYLRVPIITSGLVQKIPDTTDLYDGNAVVFNATSGASSTQAGELNPTQNYFAPSGDNGPSKVVAVYLVASPLGNDSRGDLVFSGVTLDAPISAQYGQQISVYWAQAFY